MKVKPGERVDIRSHKEISSICAAVCIDWEELLSNSLSWGSSTSCSHAQHSLKYSSSAAQCFWSFTALVYHSGEPLLPSSTNSAVCAIPVSPRSKGCCQQLYANKWKHQWLATDKIHHSSNSCSPSYFGNSLLIPLSHMSGQYREAIPTLQKLVASKNDSFILQPAVWLDLNRPWERGKLVAPFRWATYLTC